MTDSSSPIPYNERLKRILLPFAACFFITAIYRVVMAVFIPYMEKDLSLSSLDLGLIASVYFFAFAVFQIPFGILVDHYGPRMTQGIFFFIATIGAFIFPFSSSVAMLTISRLIIGIGLAGGLMGGFTANRIWFHVDKLPFYNSVTVTAGNIGAILATYPVHLLLLILNWRSISFILALLSLTVTLWVIISTPKKPSHLAHVPMGQRIRAAKEILCTRFYWFRSLLIGFSLGTLISFQSLWAAPWATHIEGMSTSRTAVLLFLLGLGFLLGCILAGLLGAIHQKLVSILLLVGESIFIALQIVIALQLFTGSLFIWFLYGLAGASGMLGYAYIAQRFPTKYAGISISNLNVLVFLVSFVLQFGIGWLITLLSNFGNGEHVAGYFTGIWICIALQIISLALFFFPVKTPTLDAQEAS